MTVNPPAAGTFVPTGSAHTRFDRNSSASAGADANSSSTIAPLNRARSLLLITLSFFLEGLAIVGWPDRTGDWMADRARTSATSAGAGACRLRQHHPSQPRRNERES